LTEHQTIPPAPDFPTGIGRPAQRALAAAGYTRLEQLTTVSETELLKLHGVGPKAIRVLGDALQSHGLAFAEGKSKQR
jgi:predicted flap endonuclease-1-like 5' DNA nuclease